MLLYTFDWGKILESFLLNVISGLIVSGLFLIFLLHLLRPKIGISKEICCVFEDVTDNLGNISKIPRYTFKIVNQSIYHAFDAKFELFAMEPVNLIGANNNLEINPLRLRTSDTTHITRFRRKHHVKDPFALYALLLHSNDDIQKFLHQNNTYVELKITLRHGLTGLADTFTQQFSVPDVIKVDHKFNFGPNFDTIPLYKSV